VADEVRAYIASLRRIARNVKRWKGEGMIDGSPWAWRKRRGASAA
jgi:hypothetical protein